MALSSKLEDWLFLFPALFLCPLFFPMKASAYSVGVDFAEALFPPSNKSPHSFSSGIKVIMNFWPTSAPSQIHFMCQSTDILWHTRLSIHSSY